GSVLAGALGALPLATIVVVFQVLWWTHYLTTNVIWVCIPYSNIFHLVTAPLNIYCANLDAPANELPALDLETAERFGASRVQDFTWKHLLDLDACTACGRCDDVCPATATGKELHPRSIILNLRDYLTLDAEPLRPLLGGAISEQALWECTTCRACMQACPVLIEHVPKIVEMRQSLVMEESRFPPELAAIFRNLEVTANPWHFPNETRGDWAEGLEIPVFAERVPDDVEYL